MENMQEMKELLANLTALSKVRPDRLAGVVCPACFVEGTTGPKWVILRSHFASCASVCISRSRGTGVACQSPPIQTVVGLAAVIRDQYNVIPTLEPRSS